MPAEKGTSCRDYIDFTKTMQTPSTFFFSIQCFVPSPHRISTYKHINVDIYIHRKGAAKWYHVCASIACTSRHIRRVTLTQTTCVFYWFVFFLLYRRLAKPSSGKEVYIMGDSKWGIVLIWYSCRRCGVRFLFDFDKHVISRFVGLLCWFLAGHFA